MVNERRLDTKKRWAMTLAALVLSVIMTAPVYVGTWKYVNGQWKYQRGANKHAYNEWIKDNDNWHYIGNDGFMETGWQQIEGYWYYLDQNGVMQSGWLKDNDKWYFLLPNGAMATSTVIDERQPGTDSIWILGEGRAESSNNIGLSNGHLAQNMQEGFSTKGYNIITLGKTVGGDRWENAIRFKGKGSYVRYNTNSKHKLLLGATSSSSQFSSGLPGKVTVHGDNDMVLYTSPDIHYNEEIIYFGADVPEQNQVRVEVSLVTDSEWDDPIILMDKLSLYK